MAKDNIIIFLFIFGITCFLSTYATAAEIEIFIEIEDDQSNAKWAKPAVQSLNKDNILERIGQSMIYQLMFRKNLVHPILIKFQEDVPKEYSFAPLRMEPPFSEKNSTFVVHLSASKETGRPAEVRRLYATEVTQGKMSDVQLPVFYQRVRASAMHRMKRLNERWHKLHDYDVQSVFKYLETVRELHKRLYIVPPGEVDLAREWMNKAIANAKRRVEKAVKLSAAKQVTEQISGLEAEGFKSLWRSIVNIQSCTERYPLLKAYWEKLNDVPTGDRIKMVSKRTGVYKGTVLSSMAKCLSINIRCQSGLMQESAKSIETLTDKISHQLITTHDNELQRLLKRDRTTLNNLKHDILSGGQLNCPELSSQLVTVD